MRRALRAHLRDVLAIIGLILAGIFAMTVILVNQRAVLPSWVPLIGTDRFALKADFSTAQAVTPGQGQSVDISGIKVGEVSNVTLQDGHAVVGMEIDNKYAPLIHTNSSLLLRPKTGLNDMVVEVDPGTQSAPQVQEGSTIPLASTAPQVNPDEVLASLDADTQQFLKLLLANGAEALDPATGRDVRLSNALRRLDPFARDISDGSPAPWPPGGRTSPTPSTTSSSCQRSSATAIRTSSTSWTPPTPCSPRSPRSRRRSAAPSRSCRGRSRRRRAP